MNPPQSLTPMANALTQGGFSMLEGLLANPGYHEIHREIYKDFTNEEFSWICRFAPIINDYLTMPSSETLDTTLIPEWQNLIPDKCCESGLPSPPIGPALPNGGRCPNVHGSNAVIKPCKHPNFDGVLQKPIHHLHPHWFLVCEPCRDNYHFNMQRYGVDRNDDYYGWRRVIAKAHVPVCRRCDRRARRDAGPEGRDSCDCYEGYYKARWLCHRCNWDNNFRLNFKIEGGRMAINRCQKMLTSMNANVALNPRLSLNQKMKTLKMRTTVSTRPAPGRMPLCPCRDNQPALARLPPDPVPKPLNITTDFVGNHLLETKHPGGSQLSPQPLPCTMQCMLCCSYVVPPVRRSKRLRQRRDNEYKRKHCMLNNKGKAVVGMENITAKGFLTREGILSAKKRSVRPHHTEVEVEEVN